MHTAVLESRSIVAAKKCSAPLGPRVAVRLLDLLSSDDAFRSLFMSNPREALLQVGFVNETGLASPHFCFGGISKLASNAQIAGAQEELRKMLIRGLAHHTRQLDVVVTGRRTLR